MATWPEPVEVIPLITEGMTSTALSNLAAPTGVVPLNTLNDILQPLGTYPMPVELLSLEPLPEINGQYPVWETVIKPLEFDQLPIKESSLSGNSILIIPLQCTEGSSYQYWG